MNALLADPLRLAVALATAVAGLLVFWQGQKRQETPQRVAGVIIALSPLVIHEMDHLLGFVGGVGLGLWMYLRVNRT